MKWTAARQEKGISVERERYMARLEELREERAKAGDSDGAAAIKAEHERMAMHLETESEAIKAMPVSLRALRNTYDVGLKIRRFTILAVILA
jgi:hypothetical protein